MHVLSLTKMWYSVICWQYLFLFFSAFSTCINNNLKSKTEEFKKKLLGLEKAHSKEFKKIRYVILVGCCHFYDYQKYYHCVFVHKVVVFLSKSSCVFVKVDFRSTIGNIFIPNSKLTPVKTQFIQKFKKVVKFYYRRYSTYSVFIFLFISLS